MPGAGALPSASWSATGRCQPWASRHAVLIARGVSYPDPVLGVPSRTLIPWDPPEVSRGSAAELAESKRYDPATTSSRSASRALATLSTAAAMVTSPPAIAVGTRNSMLTPAAASRRLA